MLSALTLTACSDDKIVGDEPKDWSSSIELLNITEDNAYTTYFKPAVGNVGDPMPFFDPVTEDFKILYLQEYPGGNDKYNYHPFHGVSTTDAVTYTGMGEVLPTGKSKDEADAALGTGCAIYNEDDGLYYIYYTGHKDYNNKEVVMRATSPDFITWTKDVTWKLNGADYNLSDKVFRDPCIFMGDDDLWHMVISSDLRFAEFTSDDLVNWEFECDFPMVWDRMCECPDVFKMGDWWYLVYSDAKKENFARKVKYFKAKTWNELKDCFRDPGAHWPDWKEGVLDSRALYAGKTASNGNDRYLWGWTPYRSGKDFDELNTNVGAGKDKEPNWSGALVCHKVEQDKDGNLIMCKVPGMDAKYNKTIDVKVMEKTEDYTLYSRLGKHNHISFTIKTTGDEDPFDISFVRGTVKVKKFDEETGKDTVVIENVKNYYSLRVNPEGPSYRKVNFWQNGAENPFIEGADGYNFPRPEDNVYNIDIYTDNSVVTMYINGKFGITQRIYGLMRNCWSINTYGKQMEVTNLTVTEY